jgi:hypothetical protein
MPKYTDQYTPQERKVRFLAYIEEQKVNLAKQGFDYARLCHAREDRETLAKIEAEIESPITP